MVSMVKPIAMNLVLLFPQQGIDHDDIFAPVAKHDSIRTVLAITNDLDLDAHQIDVKAAVINGKLDTDIYRKQTEGFAGNPSKICKLHKSIYGLKS